MKKYLLGVTIVACMLSGCAVHKDLVPTGGSKADGIVRLSYSYDKRNEIPVLDASQGSALAKKRCQAWGYKNAEEFGGSTAQCSDQRAFGCVTEVVTVEYQCTE